MDLSELISLWTEIFAELKLPTCASLQILQKQNLYYKLLLLLLSFSTTVLLKTPNFTRLKKTLD